MTLKKNDVKGQLGENWYNQLLKKRLFSISLTVVLLNDRSANLCQNQDSYINFHI